MCVLSLKVLRGLGVVSVSRSIVNASSGRETICYVSGSEEVNYIVHEMLSLTWIETRRQPINLLILLKRISVKGSKACIFSVIKMSIHGKKVRLKYLKI